MPHPWDPGQICLSLLPEGMFLELNFFPYPQHCHYEFYEMCSNTQMHVYIILASPYFKAKGLQPYKYIQPAYSVLTRVTVCSVPVLYQKCYIYYLFLGLL